MGRKLSLEEQINLLKPDTESYWKKHTINKIPGIQDCSRGIFVRKDEQLNFGVERGVYIWVTNRNLYEEKKKEGFRIIAFHKKHRIPCMFKPIDDTVRHYDWFLAPEAARRGDRRGLEEEKSAKGSGGKLKSSRKKK